MCSIALNIGEKPAVSPMSGSPTFDGNGYFAGLRMTVAKCIILNNYVAV